MKAFPLIVLLLGCAALIGCMHTVIGGNPTRSPDGRYYLGMEKHGASGKAYTARTKKRVYVWLGPTSRNNSAPSLDKKYVFVAGDLASHIQWKGSDEVTIEFYDFGDGVLASEARQRGIPSNHVGSLRFTRDAHTGRFVEEK